MCKIVAIIVNAMQCMFVAWNGFWWNYHVGRARMHDDRIVHLDPEWRKSL